MEREIKGELLHNRIYEETLRCNRCGFCQTNCPVYRATGVESSTARGHNAHVRSLIEGQMDLAADLRDPIFECLLCRACTASCFPAVETDRIIIAAREAYVQKYGQPRLQSHVFRELLTNRTAMDRAVRLVSLSKRTGITKIAAGLSLLGWFGQQLARAHRITEGMPRRFLRETVANGTGPEIKWGNDAAYFVGCGINYALPSVGLATLKCMNRLGLSVNLLDNFCCGLPPYSHGDIEAARILARKNIDLMTGLNERWIVTDCASCSSFLKRYGELLSEEPQYTQKIADLRPKIFDLTELIEIRGGMGMGTGKKRTGETIRTVSYHDPCHLSRHQNIVNQPREILKAIPGVEFKEMSEADWCCGGAGVYTILHPGRSDTILDRKMDNFARTEADLLVTSCPACIVQLRHGVVRKGMDAEVVHLSQLLSDIY